MKCQVKGCKEEAVKREMRWWMCMRHMTDFLNATKDETIYQLKGAVRRARKQKILA